jgi:hypothetical protein
MGRRMPPRCALGLPERDHLPGRLAVEIGGDLVRDQGGGGAPRVVVEVGVARGGRRVAVAEDRAEHRQPEIGRYATGRV